MKRPHIFLLVVLVGLTIPGYVVYNTLTISSRLKSVLPMDSPLIPDINSAITIRIDSVEQLFVNNKKTRFNRIPALVDSLGSLGFNDSVLILDASRMAGVRKVVDVINYARNNGKKVALNAH